MRAIAEAVATAENEDIAIAAATAIMRTKLGWTNDSEARASVLSRFALVTKQVFASLSPAKSGDAPPVDVVGALTEFESWYHDTHPKPFWVLFEHYLPETPVVDF